MRELARQYAIFLPRIADACQLIRAATMHLRLLIVLIHHVKLKNHPAKRFK